MKAAQEECQSSKGLKWRGLRMYANFLYNEPMSAAQQWSTQDPKRMWSWLVSPAYLKP